jgi:predicted Zn-dependent protease
MLAKTFLHQNKIEEARKVCLQLTHLFPQRQEFWFNLALVLKEQGTKLLNNDKTTSAQLLKTAVPNFEVAAPIFKHIAEVAPEKAKRTWGSSKCIKLASLCAANLDAAKEKAVEVSKREQAAAEVRLMISTVLLPKK